MEDDNRKEEQASTSKKENKDRVSERRSEEYNERERGDRTHSESSTSVLSVRSRLEMRADARPDIPKSPLGKRGRPERKKRVRRGRVSKRRRSRKRYNHTRRTPIKKQGLPMRERDASVSTIFTRLSSRSGSELISCTYCGHRCCRRRLTVNDREYKRQHRRTLVRKITKELRDMRRRKEKKRQKEKPKGVQKKKTAKKSKGRIKKEPKPDMEEKQRKNRGHETDKDKIRGEKKDTVAPKDIVIGDKSEAIQIGSASKMLSPLFIKTNADLEYVEPQEAKENFMEVTPEMIYESLRRLHRWREHLEINAILSDIKSRYPVNHTIKELAVELEEKLRVAVIAGIVMVERFQNIDHWCLATAISKRGLTTNHVTLFWQAFADTMSPVRKKMLAEESNLV